MKQSLSFTKLGIVVGLLLVVFEAHAKERHEFFNGVRSLGMGGVQAATVNDETALLGNPAALGKLKDYFITVADPEIELSDTYDSVIGLDVLKFMNPQDMLDAMNAGSAGKYFHESAQVFPSFVVTNFGFGLYGRYVTDAFIDETTGDYNLYYRNDIGFVFGFNFRIWDGRIKLGFTGRGINRAEIDRDDLPANSTNLTVGNLASEGFGIAGDAGLIFTAPIAGLPSLAVVARDIGSTSYTVNDGMFLSTANRPERTPQTVDAGLSVQPILGNKTRLTISAEVKDLQIAVEDKDTEDDISRRTHYGMELNASDFFFLRAGMNQNYWTFGMEMAVFNYQLQFATYGEEVGTKDVTKEDRRYVAKFSWRF